MRRSVRFAAITGLVVLAGLNLATGVLAQITKPAQQAGFAGRWEGRIDVLGSTLNIAVIVTDTGSGLKATIDIPQQSAMGLPLINVRFESPEVHFELPAGPGLGVFDGALRDGTITGTFEQSGIRGTFELKPAALKPAAPLEPPPPYRQEEVKIQSGTITLAGTLTLPPKGGPFPAVVLITGSGPQNRDEDVFGMKGFRLIADYLTRQGIAVLRCDDRGVGGSTGNMTQTTSADFADDALAQVQMLKQRPEIDKARIGLLGHSEGGLVAPIAATRSSDVAFIVLLSGPAVTGEKILFAQSDLVMKAAGGTDEAIRRNKEVQARIFEAVRTGTGWAQVADMIRGDIKAALDAAPAAQRPPADKLDALVKTRVDAQITNWRSPWFKFFLDYDPSPTLQKVKCPVLAIFGQLDLQVPVALNRDPMEQALKSGGNKSYAIEVMARANHLYQDAKTGGVQEYTTLKKEFVPELLPLVTSWILKQAPAKQP